LAYIAKRPAQSAQAQAQPQAQAPRREVAATPAPTQKPPTIEIPSGEREVFKPVSSMRKAIMENMVASKRTSAHVTTFFDIDYTAIDRVRDAHKDRFKAEEGVALTYTTFLAAAVCEVLKRHPYINAEIQGDKIRFKKDVHLGMAVAISDPEPGLVVPVIRSADQMNLRGLAHAITDLATRVRSRKIKLEEITGGSFTITNPGNYGAIIGTPVINQPQVAILGVGQIKKQAIVLEIDGTDVIAIRKIGWLSLSFDHRLIDGATADMFMADLKHTLENWTTTP
jgi:2-oxoglutarate dehydrogenase E2 component (dihydrolipoamide succinyltransferase)